VRCILEAEPGDCYYYGCLIEVQLNERTVFIKSPKTLI